MKKVAILGPESSGKSKLCEELASHYHTSYVPEYAREYLKNLGRSYGFEDLKKIAEGQIKLEEKEIARAIESGKKLIFMDTELTVIKIWSEYKYQKCDPWILDQMSLRPFYAYLLMYPDLDWEPDPLRENPLDRLDLFRLYENELIRRKLQYFTISGIGQDRTNMAISSIEQLL